MCRKKPVGLSIQGPLALFVCRGKPANPLHVLWGMTDDTTGPDRCRPQMESPACFWSKKGRTGILPPSLWSSIVLFRPIQQQQLLLLQPQLLSLQQQLLLQPPKLPPPQQQQRMMMISRIQRHPPPPKPPKPQLLLHPIMKYLLIENGGRLIAGPISSYAEGAKGFQLLFRGGGTPSRWSAPPWPPPHPGARRRSDGPKGSRCRPGRGRPGRSRRGRPPAP